MGRERGGGIGRRKGGGRGRVEKWEGGIGRRKGGRGRYEINHYTCTSYIHLHICVHTSHRGTAISSFCRSTITNAKTSSSG